MSTTDEQAGTGTKKSCPMTKLLLNVQVKLNGRNWAEWSSNILLILEAHGMEHTLDDDSDSNKQMRAVLLLAVDENLRPAWTEFKQTGKLWTAIKSKYGTPSRLMISQLKADFYGTLLGDGQGIQEFIDNKRALASKLLTASVDVKKEIPDVILVGVRMKYETVVEFFDQDKKNS